MEYESNSKRSKKEKVISGKVKPKKKSGLEKFLEIFIAEDADSVASYLLTDVLVPAFKKTVSEIVSNGIDMLLYGETKASKRASSASHISYGNYYERDERREIKPTRRYGYDDIVLDDRADAQEVLSRMDELIDCYGIVSVADLYDLVGMDCGNYTDNRYGWKDLRNAQVVRVRDGYLLKLPKAVALN